VESVQARSGARRREATAAAILAATRRLLLAGQAYSALSTDQIVKEAGVSRATFYLHFSDKKQVVSRLAYEFVEQRFAAEPLADPHIGREALDAFITDLVDQWMADGPILNAIIELAQQDPAMRETWADAIDQMGAVGAKIMRARWTDGPSPDADPEIIGRTLGWMFERSAQQLTYQPGQRDAVIRAVTEIVWRVFDYRPSASAEPNSTAPT
jgi:AcrR family transcriptional regulator